MDLSVCLSLRLDKAMNVREQQLNKEAWQKLQNSGENELQHYDVNGALNKTETAGCYALRELHPRLLDLPVLNEYANKVWSRPRAERFRAAQFRADQYRAARFSTVRRWNVRRGIE